MSTGRVLETGLRWFLLAVLIMVASSALIRWVALPQPSWIRQSEKQAQFNAAQDSKFQSLFHQGIKARNDGRYAEALSQFQKAERSVAHLSKTQYSGLN